MVKNIALVACLILLGLLFVRLRARESEIERLSKKLSGPSAQTQSAGLENQQQCAAQAATYFKSGGWSEEKRDHFDDHYNANSNRCFVLIRSYYGANFAVELYDPFARKKYATYISGSSEKAGQPSPSICTVLLPSGKEASCHSEVDFDELVKAYME